MKMLMRVAAIVAVCTASVAFAGQAAKVDVTGKWAFSVDTSSGAGSPTFTFKQEGEKLTGHYSGTFGDADLTGTVKGTAITFSFSTEVQGTKIDATYNGTIEGKDAMKGTVSYTGIGEGTFTGKKQ